ncbi:LT_GEWL domain containing protein [uncultured Caudovirales phage]|uniref:LT_GEWL domain containing protein n=1 Tax=uncultured Caudovirales phage TaxID=2100421 RepID=A0A6J5N057_9CAUD|nr:LT_GEWL domain containing protein [uncultured Caudovirales phage]
MASEEEYVTIPANSIQYDISSPEDDYVTIMPSEIERDVPTGSAASMAIDSAISGAAPTFKTESRGVLNRGLGAIGSLLGVVDEFLPIQTDPSKIGGGFDAVRVPNLFGLFGGDQEFFGNTFNRTAKEYGVMTDDKPQTKTGKFAANVAENAVGGALFGPVPAAISGITGGLGGYVGEEIGEEYGVPELGSALGSGISGFIPAAASKIRIVKELGDQFGPMVSQFPGLRYLFGKAPLEAAAGRAITDLASDPVALEKALAIQNAKIGPATQLESLRTLPEIVSDPGLAKVQSAVNSASPNAPFDEIARERAALREAKLLTGVDDKLTTYDRSSLLEGKIAASGQKTGEAVEDIWSQLDKRSLVNTRAGGSDAALATKLNEITQGGALPLEGEAKALVKRFEIAQSATDEGIINIGTLQDLRSRALQVSRDIGRPTNAADRATKQVANTIADHYENILDTNVAAGKLPPQEAELLRSARAATKSRLQQFSPPKTGTSNQGTKGLESVALKGDSLDNVALIKEGLSSPDKMASHIRAAAAGGEDVRPIYQEELLAQLSGKPQKSWPGIVDSNRNLWETAFTPDELAAKVKPVLDDVESQAAFDARKYIPGQSNTNSLGNTQGRLDNYKGVAKYFSGTGSAANLVRQAPALAGGAIGAKTGWESSDTTAGGIVNALVLGGIGAATGKALTSSGVRTAESIDNLITEALRGDTRLTARLIKQAKPSDFSAAFSSGVQKAGIATGNRAATESLKSFSNRDPNRNQDSASMAGRPEDSWGQEDPQETSAISSLYSEEQEQPTKENVSMEEKPEFQSLVKRVIQQESSGNPEAVSKDKYGNPVAYGLMQLRPSTAAEVAKSLGLEDYDLKDPTTNIQLGSEYLKRMLKQFDGDVELALTAYHSGPGRVEALLKKTGGTTLSDIRDLLGPVGQTYADQVLARKV